MQKFIKKYDIKDNPNTFFDNLADFSDESTLKSIDNSLKKREIYLYIPYELFQLSPTIEQFSDIDLRNGSATYTDTKYDEFGIYMLDDAMRFDSLKGTLTNTQTGNARKIQAFYVIERKHNLLRTSVTRYNDDKSNYNVVFSKELGRFFIIDERTNRAVFPI